GKRIEIQIRTHEMHHRAEYGVAAHWAYKRAGTADTETPGWLKTVLDWQQDASDPNDFLDSLRNEIGSVEVYVFTPKGEIKALPSGSTPVDFAYSVHTSWPSNSWCPGERPSGTAEYSAEPWRFRRSIHR